MRPFIYISLFMLFTGRVIAQELPAKNQTIVVFCTNNKGKKIGKGECWDLAKAALDKAEAVWTPPYEFGRLLTKKDKPLPGDIIQLEKVKIVNPDESWQEFPHHTAIIHKVMGPGKYLLAEQNNNNQKFVVFSEIDLNNVKKGKYMIYRPQ
jgi:myosin tail region-interacting protein MTI1